MKNYDQIGGFLRTSTYAQLVKCSKHTALRDLQDLVAKEMLKPEDIRMIANQLFELLNRYK